MSAPTMNPRSLPDMMTSPRTFPARTSASTHFIMASSSSIGRRPREFALSPSRSKIAQAMPSPSIEKRQSFSWSLSKACICPVDSTIAHLKANPSFLFSGQFFGTTSVMTERRVVWFQFRGIEMVDGDDARDKTLDFAKRLRFRSREHALGFGFRKPVDPVITAYNAVANGFFKLLLDGLGRDHFLKRHFENARRIIDILGDENIARQTITDVARL